MPPFPRSLLSAPFPLLSPPSFLPPSLSPPPLPFFRLSSLPCPSLPPALTSLSSKTQRNQTGWKCSGHPSSSCWVILLQVFKSPDSDCVSGDDVNTIRWEMVQVRASVFPSVKHTEFSIKHWQCCVLRIRRWGGHCPLGLRQATRTWHPWLLGWLATPSFPLLPYLHSGAPHLILMRIRWFYLRALGMRLGTWWTLGRRALCSLWWFVTGAWNTAQGSGVKGGFPAGQGKLGEQITKCAYERDGVLVQ